MWIRCHSIYLFIFFTALHQGQWSLQRSFLLSHVPFLISFEKSYLITSSSLWKFPRCPAKRSLLCNIRYIMVHRASAMLDPRLPSWHRFNEMLKIIRRDSGPFSHGSITQLLQMRIFPSTTSQRCCIRLTSGGCGGHLSTWSTCRMQPPENYHQKIAEQKPKVIQPGRIFQICCCTLLVSLCKL